MKKLIHQGDRIFVAGAQGMAGSAVTRALIQKGYGDPSMGGGLLQPSRLQLDLLDVQAVNDWFQANKPDVVVLAAAKVGGIYANNTFPFDFLQQNLHIQSNVIEAAWRNNVRRLLFLGSSCIYPKFAEQPIKESSLLTGSLEPTNEWYAIAKIAGIKLCQSLNLQHGFDAITLMPTNLYGPGDNYQLENSHVLPALIRRFHNAVISNASEVTCWGSGNPLREFLHVDDLADACVFALENWKPGQDEVPLLNVGTGKDMTIRELAESVSKVVGFSGNIIWDTSKPDGTFKKQLDVSRLSKMGWTSQISFSEGLKSTVNIYLDQYESGILRL